MLRNTFIKYIYAADKFTVINDLHYKHEVKHTVYVSVSVSIVTIRAIGRRKCCPVVTKIVVKQSWVLSTEMLISKTKPIEIFSGQCI